MSRRLRAERLVYEKPEALRGSIAASPETIWKAMANDVDRISGFYEAGADLVAVQGQVSSMKTWLLACTAEQFLDRAHRVVALAPQRVNRRSLVDRLSAFEVPYIEYPSRLDLCAWEPWRETVGRVDERTCSSNGCPMFPGGQDLEELAKHALQMHLLQTGGRIELDVSAARRLADKLDESVCPHYLLNAMADVVGDGGAVRVATYAKAFKSPVAGDQLAADIGLLDENHTIAADAARLRTEVDPPSIVAAMTDVLDPLTNMSEKRAREAVHDLCGVELALEEWEKALRERHVSPEELFADNNITAKGVFESLHRADQIIIDKLAEAVRSDRPKRVRRFDRAHRQLQKVREFFSRIQAHNDGDFDFVHTRYEESGEVVNEIAFQRVSDRNATCGLQEVYDAWQDEGTNPAIEKRWGGLLNHYIEAVWEGRSVVPGGDRVAPGVPPSPLADLGSITGAKTLVGYSATHSQLSDPARPGDEPRPTTHRLVTAPLQLRSDGDRETSYGGTTAVDAATPWLQGLVRRAKKETQARIAAVPINRGNAEKWVRMPVEQLELPDGQGGLRNQPGIIPNSRAAIGDKDLENLPIDAVLCGVQVQGPADTARRLIGLWDLLAPEYDDPAEVLENSWRLLAQHAVSGTIQAAGRFRSGAINLVFERPELLELAGFECEPLAPSIDGFVGEFARLLEDHMGRYEDRVRVISALKTVEYLNREPSKAPTSAQFVSIYCKVYDSTPEEATRALEVAAREGEIESLAGRLRRVREDESVGGQIG